MTRDYRPLGRYFRALTTDSITLSFQEIERILGAKLQGVARRSKTFWQNSNPARPQPDGHWWAYEWMNAGWREESVNLEDEVVTFHRVGEAKYVDPLDDVRPVRKDLIYDILESLGISAKAWHTTMSGRPVKHPKANPHYCYEWSFGSPAQGYVICLWFDKLQVVDGTASFVGNIRKAAQERRAKSMASTTSANERSALAEQAARGENLDTVVQDAFHRAIPIRAIICARKTESDGQRSSSASKRELDTVEWHVSAYNVATGECCLKRGLPTANRGESYGSQLEADTSSDSAQSEEERQRRAIWVRRGQPAFRSKLLEAYRRRCAVTGCDITELLEAAHIIPYAETMDNAANNGLLLRADIHTLFDEGLLSIDGQYNVRVSAALRHSEHWQFDGKVIALPDRSADQPSRQAVSRRRQKFVEQEDLGKRNTLGEVLRSSIASAG
jgi:hypothetical protein